MTAGRTDIARRPTAGRHRRKALLLTAAVAVAVDAATKAWAAAALATGGVELPGPLDLRLAYNRGVAFGLFEDVPPAVTIAAIGVITVVLAAAAWRGALPVLPAGLVLGGAVANLVDRLADGRVVDLLHTGWWPTFNLADVFITVGSGLLLLTSFGTDAQPSASAP